MAFGTTSSTLSPSPAAISGSSAATARRWLSPFSSISAAQFSCAQNSVTPASAKTALPKKWS